MAYTVPLGHIFAKILHAPLDLPMQVELQPCHFLNTYACLCKLKPTGISKVTPAGELEAILYYVHSMRMILLHLLHIVIFNQLLLLYVNTGSMSYVMPTSLNTTKKSTSNHVTPFISLSLSSTLTSMMSTS